MCTCINVFVYMYYVTLCVSVGHVGVPSKNLFSRLVSIAAPRRGTTSPHNHVSETSKVFGVVGE